MPSMRRVPLALMAASLLSGCNAASTMATPGGAPRDFARAESKSVDLLYVAASTTSGNAVLMLTYPQADLVGEITNFQGEPNVLCAGTNGDVFVTQIAGEAVGGYVFGYHHGSKDPFVRLNDPGTPYGCSVDPKNGNLAVANYLAPGLHGNVGNIAIYSAARGRPKIYRLKGIRVIESCSYDASGNLVADGYSTQGFRVIRLPHGSKTLVDFPLNEPVAKGGPIQWDGTYFALGFPKPRSLYRVLVSGSAAQVAHTLRLVYKKSSVVAQFWIQGSTIVGPAAARHGYDAELGFWPYPSGGKPTTFLKHLNNVSFITGVTVSLAAKGHI